MEGTEQRHIIHGPSGLEGRVSRSSEIRGWIRLRPPSPIAVSTPCSILPPKSLN